MAVSERDLELFAARVRLHFEPSLRDAAYALSLPLARVCGTRIKGLRPETTIDEIRGWIGAPEVPTEKSALGEDTVRLLRNIRFATATQSTALKSFHSFQARRTTMRLLEALRGRVILRELALRRGRTTFQQWVESRANLRRVA
jgi:hypothetical protein